MFISSQPRERIQKGNINFPWKSTKSMNFSQTSADFEGFWANLTSESAKACKIIRFSARICGFCVVFEFKTRKLFISSRSRQRIQGGNINFSLESAKSVDFGQKSLYFMFLSSSLPVQTFWSSVSTGMAPSLCRKLWENPNVLLTAYKIWKRTKQSFT